MELKEIIKQKFKNYSNDRLLKRINKRFKSGLNDDDEVFELFRRSEEQGFKVVSEFDKYSIKGVQEWKI